MDTLDGPASPTRETAERLSFRQQIVEDMKRMGNWNPSMFDNSHSSKVPMAPIKKLGGHEGKIHWVPRGEVQPCDELLRATPIGKWVYDACAGVIEADDGAHVACIQALKFLMELKKFVAQDAAATMALHPERQHHPFCTEVDVFQSELFEVRQPTTVVMGCRLLISHWIDASIHSNSKKR